MLSEVRPEELIPLPAPYDNPADYPGMKEIPDEKKERLVCNLDGVIAAAMPHPESPEEEQKYVDMFVEGLKKLLSKENNWTFLQPLTLSLENCIGCQTCADACHVFEATGGKEIYRPTYRSEVWRRLVNKYVKPGGKVLAPLKGAGRPENTEP